MSRKKTLENMFQRVRQDLSKMGGVKMALIASVDGYIISHSAEPNTEKYTKDSAAKLRTADNTTSMSGQNYPRVIIDYSDEKLIATRAGQKALIAVVVEPGTELDPIFTELDHAAWKVREIL